ncbi:MAG: hypothetical protein TR69_WS6001000164 [candidate division WS6 bacterium OLB20]|uniref:Uncharacterized protein n=1 Tax=candidate division WS6 bacterium OLB20 TaxID=1617426 RepID=A0A136M054_9BACT|nr:MAG: hypothetical protein TR69_WS6001000164 [candidate division WS6 bacterium OLB20]
MEAQTVRAALKALIKQEHITLRQIESRLSQQEPSLSNKHYLQLLSRASLHSSNIEKYKRHLSRYSRRRIVHEAIVQAGSTVKLVSTKIGATIWVDAANYAELMGKQIGDIVMMHNSPFKVAGIY